MAFTAPGERKKAWISCGFLANMYHDFNGVSITECASLPSSWPAGMSRGTGTDGNAARRFGGRKWIPDRRVERTATVQKRASISGSEMNQFEQVGWI